MVVGRDGNGAGQAQNGVGNSVYGAVRVGIFAGRVQNIFKEKYMGRGGYGLGFSSSSSICGVGWKYMFTIIFGVSTCLCI